MQKPCDEDELVFLRGTCVAREFKMQLLNGGIAPTSHAS